MKNIILIGFMGTGKTCVARALHQISQFHVLDTDTLIEQQTQLFLSELFKTKGEPFFREKETSVLQEIRADDNHIISTGGGIVLKKDNRALLRNLGIVFWLKASPNTISERLKSNNSRPLLASSDKQETIQQLLQERQVLYTKTAHIEIETDQKSIEEIAQEIWTRYQRAFTN